MMSLEYIEKLSREAGRRAAREKREPLVAFVDGDEAVFHCPNIGSYEPKGWKLVRELFVDNSGFGHDRNEPALTIDQFLAEVKAGYGYAIIEEGQFQIYIGEFEKRVKKVRKAK